MNVMPLAAPNVYSLASAIDEALAGALAGSAGRCVWCGGGPVRLTAVDIWSGEVKVVCPECASELSGIVPRHRIEVPA